MQILTVLGKIIEIINFGEYPWISMNMQIIQ